MAKPQRQSNRDRSYLLLEDRVRSTVMKDKNYDGYRAGRKVSSSSVTTTYDKGTGDVTRTHRSTDASPYIPDLTLVEKRHAPKGSVASKDVTKIPAGRITSGSTSRFGSSSLIVGKGSDSYVSDEGVSRYDPYKEKHIKKQSPNESKMTSFSKPKSKVVPKLFSALDRAMKKRMIKQRDQMRRR